MALVTQRKTWFNKLGAFKKPSRKKDIHKARTLLQRYKEHQEKVKNEPESLAIHHWYKEKEDFISKSRFYYERAGVEFPDVI